MAWVYLTLAGFFEILWAVCLKYSSGFSRFLPSSISLLGMILSVYFLSLSIKTLPLGTAYAIWTGLGALGSFIFGIILFNEPFHLLRIGAVVLIILGLILLKITTPSI